MKNSKSWDLKIRECPDGVGPCRPADDFDSDSRSTEPLDDLIQTISYGVGW